MIKKLRFRLTLVCTGVTVLVLAAMALVVLRYSESQIRSQAIQSFLGNVNAVCYNLRGQTVVDNGWLARMEAANGLGIRIEAERGPLLHTGHDAQRELLTGLALKQMEDQGYRRWKQPAGSLETDLQWSTVAHEDTVYYAAVCAVPMPGDTFLEVTMVKSSAQDMAQILRLRVVFAVSVAVASLCLFLFAWRFTHWATGPIESSYRRQNEFISAASHEMRSPLAVVQASAGALYQATPQEVHTLADTIRGEGRRMGKLLGDLLFLAAADGNRMSARFAPVEPDTLLLGVSERFERLAREKGVRLTAELPEEVESCLCDGDRMEQLLYILTDNALSFTPKGGAVTLRTGQQGRFIWFSVTDTGPGVPDDQKERIFDRFYQGDVSRTDREHYGLGLSVAKEIALLHRGELTVADGPHGGAVFTCAIPLSQKA